MRFPARPAKATASAAVVFAALTLVACGGSPADESDSTGAPSASEFPKADGRSLQQVLGDVGMTDQTVVSPAGAIFSPGDKRFGFGVFDVGGSPVTDAKVAIYAQAPGSKEALGPFPAKVESLHTDPAYVAKTTVEDPDAAQVVYVADVPFDKNGEYQLGAVLDDGSSQQAVRVAPGAVVGADNKIPDIGDKAPVVDTPTVNSAGGDISSIDTRIPPDDMHEINLADAIGKKPVVLLFATPQLCQSRVCGPVVDVEEQVESEYKDEVDFIHMEIYANNKPPKLRSQVMAYGLPTEPWLFVIGKDGRVADRIEGAFSVGELEDAVKKVLPSGSSA
jgi:hypothetical protein